MADYIPKFPAGAVVTLTTSADVTGGHVVELSAAGTVAHAAADSAKVVGVAARDSKSGEQVAVFVGKGTVHRLVASAAIAAGAKVITATGGKVATIGAGTNPVGLALTAATNADDVIEVLV
ncbi:capsid cement protein [Gulosibacter molinativorax]|uniref:capsid cement protein n=1 Tax=Gulosibacter molinativorax TaxID=256821 RepID=UPI000D0B28CE|nr:capsid cement protein [Gulosibacter molinativorax]QUY60890.1 Hypotetical protein [Gulosibacter molinativorax]